VFDVETQVVLVYPPITQVNKGRLRLGAKGLHQDAGLFHLLTERVPVIRIAREGSGTHNLGAFECGGNAHLHTKLIRVAVLAFGDALDFWGVPAVQLGLFVLSLFAARLGDQPFGFVDARAQSVLDGPTQGRHLACDLAAELDQLGWVAGPAVFKVFVARKVLSSGCLAPALDEVFVASVEGVFEVQQGDHQAGGQAGATGFGDASTGNHFGRTKQVRIFDLPARAHLAGKVVGKRSFDFLPSHAVGQNGQWVPKVDHLIEAVTKEIGGDVHMSLKIPRNQATLNINVGVLNFGNDSESQH
jgi:hypothetical protein